MIATGGATSEGMRAGLQWEFKLAVVRQVAGGEKRPAQACREHGIAEGLLLHWRREYEARGEACML